MIYPGEIINQKILTKKKKKIDIILYGKYD